MRGHHKYIPPASNVQLCGALLHIQYSQLMEGFLGKNGGEMCRLGLLLHTSGPSVDFVQITLAIYRRPSHCR